MQANWNDNYIQIDGATLHYLRTGDGSKPPLVLAHGFTDNGVGWQVAAEDLEADFDVILPDARGHGLSARVARGETIDAAGDLAALLGALGIHNAIVGGHSMGAEMSANLGARFPQLVRALLLEDPPWRKPEPSSDRPAFMSEANPLYAWLAGMQQLSIDEVIAVCHKEHPTWADLSIRCWAAGKQQLDLNFFTHQDAVVRSWQDTAAAIRCPVLLIGADPQLGGIITAEIAEQAQQINPLFRSVTIPGAGHHIHFENYPAFIQLVRSFLGEIG